jgi:hypothetical protein
MPAAAIRVGTREHATTYDGGELELFAVACWKSVPGSAATLRF